MQDLHADAIDALVKMYCNLGDTAEAETTLYDMQGTGPQGDGVCWPRTHVTILSW